MTFLHLGEFTSGEILKIVTFTMKNRPGSIPNDSRIGPEPFWSNFDVIFALWDPKTVDLKLKLINKFKSMPGNCRVS